MAAQNLRSVSRRWAGLGSGCRPRCRRGPAELEYRLPEAAGQAGRELKQPIEQLLRAVQPLTWIGGTLGVLVAADLLVRVLK